MTATTSMSEAPAPKCTWDRSSTASPITATTRKSRGSTHSPPRPTVDMTDVTPARSGM